MTARSRAAVLISGRGSNMAAAKAAGMPTAALDAVPVTQQDYRRAIGRERLNRFTSAVQNSEAAILRRVNPAGR